MSTDSKHLSALIVASTTLVAGAGCSGDAPKTDHDPEPQVHFLAGSLAAFDGPADFFSGQVHVQPLFPENDTASYSAAYVTFAPGARSVWHQHPAGQHMIVTAGTALTGTRDGKVLRFETGDAVWCPPDVDHWHGATPDAAMTHLVVTGSRDGKNVIWKEHVDVETYTLAASLQPRLKIASLDAREQALIPIAAATASGDMATLRLAFESGLDAGLTVNEAREIPLHVYAYAGFPRSLNALTALMQVLDARAEEGIEETVGDAPNELPQDGVGLSAGKAIQTQLAGAPVEGPLFEFAPAANEFLQRHLFGDLFARGVLDHGSREIVTIAALAALEGVESQLKAHIRIGSNAGLSQSQLLDISRVLQSTVGRIPKERVEKAIEAVLPMDVKSNDSTPSPNNSPATAEAGKNTSEGKS